MKYIKNFRKSLLGGLLMVSVSQAMAQTTPIYSFVISDTTKPQQTSQPLNTGLTSFREVIPATAHSQKGLFTIHKVDNSYFFEIADAILGRDILVISRVSKSGADLRNPMSMSGYAGDEVNSNVISFQKGPNNKIYIINRSFTEHSKDSTKEMYLAVTRSNIQPIAVAFDAKVKPTDSNGTVIDVTDYISGDNDLLHFNNSVRANWHIGGFQPDKSYIVNVKSFSINTEIKAVKTYSRATQGASGNVTLELNTSMVLLPELPMKKRIADPRVGYFEESYTDFDADPQGVKRISIAKRWRLEPKPADIAKYKKGELVEPQKQIVFYVDPATPKKWVPYLIQGINDWNKAFEKAGFKNAIAGKVAPSEKQDSVWSLEDARHSAIVYKPSSIPNANGPIITDPRSGEIIESHVNWYHNVMHLLRNWYLIQTAAVDPKARKMQFDDELMGQLIRFVSSHEIGHALGLRHNYGSSSTVPVEMLRDKKFVEKNGHTPSIMDYSRFNYVAQPEDKIGEAGLFPRIGEYDLWAIEWAYRWTDETVEAETAMLNKITTEKQKNKRLWFGHEANQDDPRSQDGDLGDNAMLAGSYGIKNLQRILPNIPIWTSVPNENYSNLKSVYDELIEQFVRYIGHVSKNIGGIMESPKTIEQGGGVYEWVSKKTQQEAVKFLHDQVFATPAWLINEEIFSKTGDNALRVVGYVQEKALSKLINLNTMEKLINAEAAMGDSAFTIIEMMDDLKAAVWSELNTKVPIDIYRRALQRAYVVKLIAVLSPAPASVMPAPGVPGLTVGMNVNDKGEAIAVVKAHLKSLSAIMKSTMTGITDARTKIHLEDLVQKIDGALPSAK
ncbi:zinc-dependent metalloprotease [Pseudoflavitalea rhizosphaerae]|uniref:zinc-dependent metalloprotease n=1 Tax=Pseudoflavitalea rhizosphaerae TaxID=1884793 RepID=UPI000F8EA508|nr:zinc-dependent metalloprotease [Pseudoflavitalea rhizosphaerae]